jgi:hypothetical protein
VRACETRRVLRCVYVDLDRTLRGAGGSILHAPDGSFTLLGMRALEACARADAEPVLFGEDPAEAARLLGLSAWIADGVLVLDGEELVTAGLADAVERHLRARACAREDAIAVAGEPGLEAVVGTLWLAGGALDDPLLRLELEERPRVRMAEERGPAAVYEAVVTTLAERRAAG